MGMYDNDDSFLENSLRFLKKYGSRIAKYTTLGTFGLVGLLTSFYTVPTDSQAVVKRFGAYNRTTEPGIHITFPFHIETVEKVPVRRVQRQEFGFRTVKSGIKSQYESARDSPELESEALMLTGDLNMAEVEFLVQYKIKDPKAYLFNVKEPTKTIRDSALAVMKQIIGDGSVDEAITIGRIDNEHNAQVALQEILDSYKTGIDVVAVKLQSCNPPKGVGDSFNAVNRALQEKETKINDAMKAYNSVIPKAKGEAEQTIKEAQGYATERVNKAEGDVSRFEQMRVEYVASPEITRKRLWFETMEEILPKLEKTIVEQKGAEGGLLMHLGLGEKK